MNDWSTLILSKAKAQVRKRRIACAEIVHGDAHAQRLDPIEGCDRAGEVANERRFRDLDFQLPGGKAGLGEDRLEIGEKIGGVQLDG